MPPRAKQDRHRVLTKVFPIVHQCLNDPSASLLEEWQSYRKQHPAGYCYSQFSNLYGQWLSTNQLQRHQRPRRSRWAIELSTGDIKILKEWRSSNNKRMWQRAVALQDLHKGCTIASICRKLERSPKTIKGWRRAFVSQGLDNFATPLKRAVKRHRSHRHRALFKLFPAIHRSLSERGTYLLDEWRAYQGQSLNGYGYSQFTNLYGQWLSSNQLVKPPSTRYALRLEREDAILLKKWRSSSNKRKWKRAVALEGLHKGSTLRSICQKGTSNNEVV